MSAHIILVDARVILDIDPTPWTQHVQAPMDNVQVSLLTLINNNLHSPHKFINRTRS